MSGPNAALTLPPGDRDDAAPPLPLTDAPAPSSIDDNHAVRIARLGRFITEANKEFFAALCWLCTGDQEKYRARMRSCSQILKEAGPLSRLLADRPASRATPKE